jgi:hypothetical protein
MIGSWEVPRIERIRSFETRRLVVMGVPGLSGDLHQDLGRGALAVQIEGSLSGDEARDDFLKELRQKFLAGDPVDFVADIVKESQLEKVLIVALDLTETAGDPDSFRYRIIIHEYTEPPDPPGLGADFGANVDAGLGLDADLGLKLLDLPGIVADVPKVGDLLSPLQPAAQNLKSTVQQAGALLDPLKNLFG